MKYQNFLSENFHFLVVKFSIYLNRRIFVTYVLNIGVICVSTLEIVLYACAPLKTKIIIWVLSDTHNRIYSRLSFPQLRLFRITAYLEVKIWSLFYHGGLATGNKIFSICRPLQESNHILICEMCLFDLFFSSIMQIWYVDLRISHSISESLLTSRKRESTERSFINFIVQVPHSTTLKTVHDRNSIILLWLLLCDLTVNFQPMKSVETKY